MAKKRSISSPRKNKSLFRNRRFYVFVIAIVLIGLMIWQVLMTLGTTSQATFNKQGVCRREDGDARKRSEDRDEGKSRGWRGFSLCKVDKPNCAEGCTCVPFRSGFKWGRCIPQIEVTPTPTMQPPTPTQSPPGMLSCGDGCESDSQCASGYCHDPNWQACPTETPTPSSTVCTPRPKCLDTSPRCLPPEPAGGWCPKPNEPTSTPKPTKPPKQCPIRSNSLIPLQKQCRDRGCFAGEQCACPVQNISQAPTPGGGTVCTADAKMCADGSFVSRQGPSCEFAPCPGE